MATPTLIRDGEIADLRDEIRNLKRELDTARDELRDLKKTPDQIRAAVQFECAVSAICPAPGMKPHEVYELALNNLLIRLRVAGVI